MKVADLPDMHGMSAYIKKLFPFAKASKDAIEGADCAIIRLPSMSASMVLHYFKKTKKKYALEVVVDPEDAYASNNIAKLLFTRLLKKQCIEADGVSYVTKDDYVASDITNFSDVIRTCRSKGGEMAKVTKSTSQIISDKIETKEEIETLLTGKRYESRIMSAMPIFMVAVLSVMSPDYMAPVFDFSRVIGPVVMTVAIGIFTLSFFWSEHIMDIEV